MSFTENQYLWLLLLIPSILILYLLWGKRRNNLVNTQTRSLDKARSHWASVLTAGMLTCKGIISLALILAIAGFGFNIVDYVMQSDGTAYFAQDTSSSMKDGTGDKVDVKLAALYDPRWENWHEPVRSQDPWHQAAPYTAYPSMIDASLGAIKYFIQQSSNLRIGLTAVDDDVFHLYPATKNHALLIDLLPQIHDYVMTHDTGDNFCGPAARFKSDGIGQAAIDLFKHEPQDGPHILIMVSDGDFDCTPEREAYLKAEFAKLHIKMFVFGVGSDWREDRNEAPAFKSFLKMIDGELIPVEDFALFTQGMQHINQIADAGLHKVKVDHRVEALLILLGIALVAFIIYLILAAIRRSSTL